MDVSGVEIAAVALVGLRFLWQLADALLDWSSFRQAERLRNGVDR